MSARFVVQVDADQFDRLARPTRPLPGVAELIWNALDAEADSVAVSIALTEMQALESVSVSDNGHGMTHSEALRDFERLGGSWKKSREKSKNDLRRLHGKEGAGRFRAFAIGRSAEWRTIARDGTGLERTRIVGSIDNSEFTVSDPETVEGGEPGTEVLITRPREHANRLLGEDATPWLVTQFAVYLLKYHHLTITYDGASLDPSSIIASEADYQLASDLGGEHGSPLVRIIEWVPEANAIRPSIVLCTDDGVALDEITAGVDLPSRIPITAYLSWAGFAAHVGELSLSDGHPVIAPILEAARQKINEYVESRLNEHRLAVIDRWKADHVYPYSGDATTAAEAQERKVFDVVAVTAAPAVSEEAKAARLSLRLIKEALSQPPGALHRVLTEVLDLTPEQLEDFDRLIERTGLAAIIHTGKLVTDRLDFLSDVEAMLFDHGKRERLLERRQLHRVLANQGPWIFGERFGLAVDDQGLTKVLEAHKALLGEDPPDPAPVTDVEGHTRIVDLMLSRASLMAERREHLVVELKRPAVTLGQTELAQIANYAVAVTRDDRFKSPDVSWDFWLVGDAVDEVVEELANQKDSSPGLYAEGANYRIWVRRWAEILEENRQRLHFFREHLDYVEPEDAAELDAVVDKYLSPEVASKA
jgi:hypothetical protein